MSWCTAAGGDTAIIRRASLGRSDAGRDGGVGMKLPGLFLNAKTLQEVPAGFQKAWPVQVSPPQA
jgi:hypothetical protein